MIIKIIGFVFLIAALAVIALLYHLMTQTLWHDIIEEEYEERYRRDFERRWQNQDVRIHAQLVITDEMEGAAWTSTRKISESAHIA